jgi:hypothetical protein
MKKIVNQNNIMQEQMTGKMMKQNKMIVGGVWFLTFCLFVLPGVFRKVCIECCPLSGFSAFLLFVVLTFLGESVAGSGLFVLPLVAEACQ